MRTIALMIMFMLSTAAMSAAQVSESYAEAAKLYQDKKYGESAKIFEEIIHNGYESVEVYYNLGNAYYKQNKIPEAILNYERALRLNPEDEDTKINLKIANLQVKDKIEPMPEFFLTDWHRAVRGLFASDTWSWWFIIVFALFILSIGGYLFLRSPGPRRLAFLGAAATFLISVTCFVFAMQTYEIESTHNYAIIFAPNVYVKSSPDQGSTDLFILHSGTRLQLLDELGDWRKIRLDDGKVGWIDYKAIEII